MSTPERPLLHGNNAFMLANGVVGYKCCGGNSSVEAATLWWEYAVGLGARGAEIQPFVDELGKGRDPHELWCRRCETALESFRDDWADALPLVLNAFASVVSFVPGIGTGVAAAFALAASLASGNSISDAMIDAAVGALPAGAAANIVLAGAAEAGKQIIDGEPVDEAFLAGARASAQQAGELAGLGDLGGAAFDATLAISRGQGLQEAGFATLRAFAKGNTLAERALRYGEIITVSVQEGRPLEQVLVDELVVEVHDVVRSGVSEVLRPAINRIQRDPSLAWLGSEEFGRIMTLAEPLARAAQAVMRDPSGVPDYALLDELAKTPMQRAVEKFGAKVVATRITNVTEQKAIDREALLLQMLKMDPNLLSFSRARAENGDPLPPSRYYVHVPLERPIVRVQAALETAPSSARSGAGSDVALGGVVAAAAVALFFWAKR